MFEDNLIIATSWKPNKAEFFRALKIRETGLGAKFFGEVYEAFFEESIELKYQYIRYYSVEYPTLRAFMEIKYGETLSEGDLDKEFIFAISHLPQIVDVNYDNNKLDMVIECIEQLEKVDEIKT